FRSRRFAGVQDGDIVTYEFRVQDAGGTWHWLSTRETVFNRTADGRVRQVVGAAQDISERKLAEQRAAILQEITNQFSEAATPRQIGDAIVQGSVAALGGHAGGVALLSEDGKAIVPVSEYGFAPDTLELFSCISLDRRIPFVDAVRTGKPVWIRTLDEYLAGYPELKEVLAANGSQSNASLPLVAGGRVIGGFGISFAGPNSFAPSDRDLLLTLAQQCAQAIDRARLYEAEKKARKAAEEADRLKMQFLGMISHELRTPLTSIKGFTTTLLAEDVSFDSNEQCQFLHIVDQEADKLTDLVDQLLDLSRLQAGKLRIQSQPSTLAVIFDNAAVQLQLLTINHRLEIHTGENLPPVLADQQRIAQVLVNLVNNAAKFSSPGTSIAMTARVCGGKVQIDVGDQGMGIPPEARPLVFEAFRQVERKESTSRGAGLGLAICKGIVEAHGQRIWISDNTPQGTVISFTLAAA
ncbi:MAG: ATP-binding protein, partial [Chloroflexi bacterium]|nr:ATP-binding protein [Chloroflexota bacterium]